MKSFALGISIGAFVGIIATMAAVLMLRSMYLPKHITDQPQVAINVDDFGD